MKKTSKGKPLAQQLLCSLHHRNASGREGECIHAFHHHYKYIDMYICQVYMGV